MKFRNFSNFSFDAVRNEVFTKPSLTIPDQQLSLREMLVRFVRTGGQGVQLFKGEYVPDTMVPVGFERMTEQERLDMARNLRRSNSDNLRRFKSTAPAESVTDEPSTEDASE